MAIFNSYVSLPEGISGVYANANYCVVGGVSKPTHITGKGPPCRNDMNTKSFVKDGIPLRKWLIHIFDTYLSTFNYSFQCLILDLVCSTLW